MANQLSLVNVQQPLTPIICRLCVAKHFLPMSLLIFVVCAVLLGGQFVRHLDAAEIGWALASVVSPPPKSSDPPPRTCKDVKAVESRTVVRLSDGLEVLCDTDTDGGGWLVFQRRVSADVDFYRNWIDYKYGFGDIRGNFWLGNENIHRLTFLRQYELRVDFTYNGRSYFAQYSKFRILGEAEKYQLEVGDYSGNAGDGFGFQSQKMSFTTKDRDNDKATNYNCAIVYHGAWWYRACHASNLNGLWGSNVYAQGLNWFTKTGHHASATSTEMKIRPIG